MEVVVSEDPRLFSLRAYLDDDADTSEVVAWGISLPDGSAIAVGSEIWAGGIAKCGSAESAARLFGADLEWYQSRAL
jgi:hypothetical protein